MCRSTDTEFSKYYSYPTGIFLLKIVKLYYLFKENRLQKRNIELILLFKIFNFF